MSFISYLIATNTRLVKDAFTKKRVEKSLGAFTSEIDKATVVKSGPFAGLVYPKALAYGSSFYPKILGTYEKEIQPYFDELRGIRYDTVIDIGSAEGYYAVGLKRHFRGARVFAIDVNPKAREFCKKMAELNNCTDDFEVLDAISPVGLKSIIGKRTLIVSDCEGYEAELFRQKDIDFTHCDLIIETHDFIDSSISTKIESYFSETHYITRVQSLDDNLKAKYYELPTVDVLSFNEKKYLVSEHRPQTMEWLICKSKEQN